jgi:hypothetical protein
MLVHKGISYYAEPYVPDTPIYNSKLKKWLSRWFNVRPDGYAFQMFKVDDVVYLSPKAYREFERQLKEKVDV